LFVCSLFNDAFSVSQTIKRRTILLVFNAVVITVVLKKEFVCFFPEVISLYSRQTGQFDMNPFHQNRYPDMIHGLGEQEGSVTRTTGQRNPCIKFHGLNCQLDSFVDSCLGMRGNNWNHSSLLNQFYFIA
jgi:hypothetical protein